MSKKKERRSDITTGLFRPMVVLVLLFWLVGMGVITHMAANMTRDQFDAHFTQITDALPQYTQESQSGAVYDVLSCYQVMDEYAGRLPMGVIRPDPRDYFGFSVQIREFHYEETEEGLREIDEIVIEDGNYLFFHYPQSTAGTDGYAVIDLEETAYGRELLETLADGEDRNGPCETGIDGWTGYFEGVRFHLVEVVDWPDHWAQANVDPEDRRWIQTVGEETPGQKLVTLYPSEVSYHLAYREPVTVDGVTYESLEELHRGHYSRQGLLERVSGRAIYDRGDDSNGGSVVDIVMHDRSLAYAVVQIWPLYIVSLLLSVAVLVLFRRWIRRCLVMPAQEMIRQEGGTTGLPSKKNCWSQLQALYDQLRARIQELDRENTELRAVLDQKKDAEAQRKKTVSHISHELKTPLAIIHSYAEGLDEGIAGEKQSQYLDVILEETENMDALVLEMLDHSRMEAGQIQLRSDRFSLAQLTRQILEVLQPLVTDRGLTLETKIMEDLQIVADEARISQAIRNLVSNAIKYTRPGGKIWVHVYRDQDKIHFTIENQCDPLSDEALEGIWQSYYRTETTPKANGTGLGLPIVKAIIGLHGGTCTAENTSQGVMFRFTLDQG